MQIPTVFVEVEEKEKVMILGIPLRNHLFLKQRMHQRAAEKTF